MVLSWIIGKGNLCWELNNKGYVKLKNGYTTTTDKNESVWRPSDCHTKARAPPKQIEAHVAQLRQDATQLATRLID